MLTVDLAAVRGNYRALAARASVPLIPMVKADAYGMGAVAVSAALAPEQPLAFGVATVAEGCALRDAGITAPIIVFTPALGDALGAAHAARLTLTLDAPAVIRAWRQLGGAWHLQVDTGMSRAGIRWDDAAGLQACLQAGDAPTGVFTHFHSADSDPVATGVQRDRFEAVIRTLPSRPPLLHAENTAAILAHGPSRYDCARPGVGLYGVAPGDAPAWTPTPVATLTAPVVSVRWIRAGDVVSYGATWSAARPTRIATVAAGYADGYPRGVTGAAARIRGQHVPIVGVVTMDMLMCDVTDVPCEPGDEATLLDGTATVGVVAQAAGRSPYEVLTGLAARAARRVVQ